MSSCSSSEENQPQIELLIDDQLGRLYLHSLAKLIGRKKCQGDTSLQNFSDDAGKIFKFLVHRFDDLIIYTSEKAFDAEKDIDVSISCAIDTKFTQKTGEEGVTMCKAYQHESCSSLICPSLKIFRKEGNEKIFVFMTVDFFNFLKLANDLFGGDSPANNYYKKPQEDTLPPVSESIPIPDKATSFLQMD